MIDYDLYFEPHRPDDGDPNSPVVLVPIVISEDGRRFVSGKVVDTMEKALSFYSGFTLVAFLEDEGGFDAVLDNIEERKKEEAVDGVRETEE